MSADQLGLNDIFDSEQPFPPPAPATDLTTRLAEELLWKLEHPQQHSSGADAALADFAEQADPDRHAELLASIRRWLA